MIRFTLALAALATAAPALASDPAAKTATIRTADLDLSNPADARTLNRRVAGATEAVCGSYAGARDGAEERIAACRADVARQLAPRLAAARAQGRVAAR
ncbi:MAG: UrcA family protein [Pseudomonadota bacterium]